MGKRPEDCPELPMPLHTVIQLTPLPYGCEVRCYCAALLPVAAFV